MQTETLDRNLIKELERNSDNPPGHDPSLGCFYGAVLEMVGHKEPITGILTAVKRIRPERTDKLIANLLFRAVQHRKMEEGDLLYRDYRETAQWRKDLCRLTTDLEFIKTLLNRSTNTTLYERYAGPYALIAHFFGERGVTVADLGCGGNYGLRGIELGEPFQEITDHTPRKHVSLLLKRPVNLVEGLAIDEAADPDTEENRKWLLACSVYPKELDKLPSIRQFQERIKGSRKIRFMQTDLLTDEHLPEAVYNAVILSTILYQLHPENQNVIVEKARSMLTEDGILIVQDFATKKRRNPYKLDFDIPWFAGPYTYRTFITGKQQGPYQEVYRWSNGRCGAVKPGKDFAVVFKTNQTSSARAAFAQSTS